MTKRAGFALLLGLIVGGCAVTEPHEIDPSSIRPLIEFVERETGYRLDPLPRIIVDRERMSKDWSGTASVWAYVPRASFSAASGEPIIYLDHTRYQRGSVEWDAALVHELTHHGQYLAYMRVRRMGPEAERKFREQRGWLCSKSTEWEAEGTEVKYLRRRDPALAARLESGGLANYASCPRGWDKSLFNQ